MKPNSWPARVVIAVWTVVILGVLLVIPLLWWFFSHVSIISNL